jgi:hypothetical protein
MAVSAGNFQRLDMPGEGITSQVGKPLLPVVRRLVEVPLGASVSLGEVTASVEQRPLEQLGLEETILPVQPPVPKIPGAAENAPFVIDEEHYRRDEFWPPELVRIREAGIRRQTRMVLVEIFPVRYNARRGLVSLCSQVELSITLQDGDADWTRTHQRRYTDVFTTRWNSSRLFIKTEPQPLPMEGWSATPVGYLMVVPDGLFETLKPLVDWKRREGFEVTVAMTSQTGSGREAIQNFIKNAYQNWEIPPTFLLLVGDVNYIPAFAVGGITTDLYYSTMNEEDYLPDIQVGRLAVADSTDLAAVVEKIVKHEMGLWETTDDWTRRGYFMASNDSWYHGVAEGTQDYSMSLCRANGMICDSLYAYYGTGTPVSTALNDGRTMAIYTGHGSYTTWQGPAYTQSNIAALANGQMYPLVCSHACNTGGYHRPICFGESWLRAEDKGAAAFWGSSVSSYWDEDDILQRAMFDAMFDSSLTWLSGMMDKAKLELLIYYGGAGLTENYYRQYNLLGDPSMHLWTRPPGTLVVEHDDFVNIGISAFAATVQEPGFDHPGEQDAVKSAVLVPAEGALVSVVADGDQRGLAETVRGLVSVALDPPLTKEETVDVTVSKRGFRPYVGTAEVKANGPYLLYSDHLLDDSGGNGDGQANAGESFQLTVTIENSGNEQADAVTATLSENDPYAQMSRSSADFGDIAAKGASIGWPPYECQISTNCPSGHVVTFTLIARDAMDRRWFSEIDILVAAPDVVYHDHQMEDGSPGGNGNGVAEAGETVDLTVILRNQGLAQASGVSAALMSTRPDIQIVSDSAGFGDLAPEAQSAGDIAYQLEINEGVSGLLSCDLILDITAGEGYTATDTFAILVGTPGFSDDMEAGEGNWTHTAVTQGYVDHWHLSQQRSHRDSSSWKCGAAGSGNYSHYEDAALITPPILLAANSTLTFWHWITAEVYDSRWAWDGGLVEISADGGEHWEQIFPTGGYPYTIYDNAPSAGTPFEAGTPCFSGSNDWQQEQFDLSAYSGLIQLRFRFGSDQYTEKEGWYIDDVMITESNAGLVSVPRPQILLSGRRLHLVWAPADGMTSPVRYEVYRAPEPEDVIRRENLVKVVSEPSYQEPDTVFGKTSGALFYAVIAIDAEDRRSPASPLVGFWRRAVK